MKQIHMPVLKTTRETKDVELKSAEGGVVKVITSVLGEDIEKILKGKESGDSPLFPLTIIVKEWNLTDEAGAVLPITLENLRMLKLSDVTEIFNSVEGLDSFFGQAQSAASKN